MAGRFVADPGFEQALRRSAEYGAAIRAATEQGAREAQQLARREAYDTGAYHDSIRADTGMEAGEFKGRINAMDWKSHFLEFGSARPGLAGRARRILSRGAQAAGLRFTEGR